MIDLSVYELIAIIKMQSIMRLFIIIFLFKPNIGFTEFNTCKSNSN